MKKKIDELLNRLKKSKFRSSFKLSKKDISYIDMKGINKIEEHAYDFVNKRLRDVSDIQDGKQTPMRGHPVFIAQHATATCCRGCLEKWHHIEKGKKLTDSEVYYVVMVIMTWIKMAYDEGGKNDKI